MSRACVVEEIAFKLLVIPLEILGGDNLSVRGDKLCYRSGLGRFPPLSFKYNHSNIHKKPIVERE